MEFIKFLEIWETWTFGVITRNYKILEIWTSAFWQKATMLWKRKNSNHGTPNHAKPIQFGNEILNFTSNVENWLAFQYPYHFVLFVLKCWYHGNLKKGIRLLWKLNKLQSLQPAGTNKGKAKLGKGNSVIMETQQTTIPAAWNAGTNKGKGKLEKGNLVVMETQQTNYSPCSLKCRD